jgi:SAM-dependent MidA family methyltransferase
MADVDQSVSIPLHMTKIAGLLLAVFLMAGISWLSYQHLNTRSQEKAFIESRHRSYGIGEIHDELTIAPRLHAEAAHTFYSFRQFIDTVLYHPRWGYYTSGQATIPGSFLTYPYLLSPYFGRMVAEHAIRMRQHMVKAGALGPDEQFTVLEMGGGEGPLAQDFLDYVLAKAKTNQSWRDFQRHLRYIGVDISPAMIDRQKRRLADPKYQPLFQAVVGDVREPVTLGGLSSLKGLAFANELIDTFGSHKVLLSATEAPEAAFVLPLISRDFWQRLKTEPAPVDEKLAEDIRHADQTVRERFDLSTEERDLYLSREVFERLMDFQRRPHPDVARGNSEFDLLKHLRFREIYLPVDLIPELAETLHLEAHEIRRALPQRDGVIIYEQAGVKDLMSGLGAILEEGYVLFVDYGYGAAEMIEQSRNGTWLLRTFPGKEHDPYRRLTLLDVTFDIDWTAVAEYGRMAGFEEDYFGPQGALADATPFLSALPDAAGKRFLDERINFRALLMHKGGRTSPYHLTDRPALALRAISSAGHRK